MKTRITRPLCLGITLALLVGLFLFPAGAANGLTANETVGYSADRITTALPENAVDILTLAADGSNYESTTAKDFYIADAEGLVRLSEVTNHVKAGFAGKTVWLKNDIDMSGVTDFKPIGYWTEKENAISGVDAITNCFSGTFDGLGHTISNLVMESSSGVMLSLFGAIRAAVIRNLVIDETCRFSYTGTDNWARTAAVVSCIAVRGQELGKSPSGETYAVLIDNVETRATVIAARGNAGGIAAGGICQTSYYPYIRNCTNRGSITAKQESAGGIVSRIENFDKSLRGVLIENCLNAGSVKGGFEAGGILGDFSRGAVVTKLRSCVNRGTVHANTSAGGMISAFRLSSMEITNCANYGEVTATNAGPCYGLLVNNADTGKITGFVNYRVPGVMLHGYQLGRVSLDESGVSRRAVRLVASVDSLDYRAVGFHVDVKYTRNGEEKTQRLSEEVCHTVYDSLLAVEDTNASVVTAEDLRGTGYLYALVLDGLDVGIGTLELTVTPYLVSTDGEMTDGASQVFTVSLS